MNKPVEFSVIDTYAPGKQRRHTITIEPCAPATVCTIRYDFEPFFKNPARAPIAAVGKSICKHGDRYDYETGLRLALKSALRGIEDKNVRGMAWRAYLALFPVDKRTPEMEQVTAWMYSSSGKITITNMGIGNYVR